MVPGRGGVSSWVVLTTGQPPLLRRTFSGRPGGSGRARAVCVPRRTSAGAAVGRGAESHLCLVGPAGTCLRRLGCDLPDPRIISLCHGTWRPFSEENTEVPLSTRPFPHGKQNQEMTLSS